MQDRLTLNDQAQAAFLIMLIVLICCGYLLLGAIEALHASMAQIDYLQWTVRNALVIGRRTETHEESHDEPTSPAMGADGERDPG